MRLQQWCCCSSPCRPPDVAVLLLPVIKSACWSQLLLSPAFRLQLHLWVLIGQWIHTGRGRLLLFVWNTETNLIRTPLYALSHGYVAKRGSRRGKPLSVNDFLVSRKQRVLVLGPSHTDCLVQMETRGAGEPRYALPLCTSMIHWCFFTTARRAARCSDLFFALFKDYFLFLLKCDGEWMRVRVSNDSVHECNVLFF